MKWLIVCICIVYLCNAKVYQKRDANPINLKAIASLGGVPHEETTVTTPPPGPATLPPLKPSLPPPVHPVYIDRPFHQPRHNAPTNQPNRLPYQNYSPPSSGT